MRGPPLHTWPATEAEALDLQALLAGLVRIEPLPPLSADTLIAGCDLAYDLDEGACHGAVVVAKDYGATVVAEVGVTRPVPFPYVPGLLSFREVPVLLAAFEALPVVPDVVVCDGQGIAHPRRFGLACHLGLWLDRPTVGCAKSWLVGAHEIPNKSRGCTPLVHDGTEVGAVVRRIAGVNPLYVSPGHRIDVAGAVAVVLAGAGDYRIPEPLRRADILTRALRGEAQRRSELALAGSNR